MEGCDCSKKIYSLMLAVILLIVAVTGSSDRKCDVRVWYLNIITDDIFNTELNKQQLQLKQSIEDLVLKSASQPETRMVDCHVLYMYNDMLKELFNYETSLGRMALQEVGPETDDSNEGKTEDDKEVEVEENQKSIVVENSARDSDNDPTMDDGGPNDDSVAVLTMEMVSDNVNTIGNGNIGGGGKEQNNKDSKMISNESIGEDTIDHISDETDIDETEISESEDTLNENDANEQDQDDDLKIDIEIKTNDDMKEIVPETNRQHDQKTKILGYNKDGKPVFKVVQEEKSSPSKYRTERFKTFSQCCECEYCNNLCHYLFSFRYCILGYDLEPTQVLEEFVERESNSDEDGFRSTEENEEDKEEDEEENEEEEEDEEDVDHGDISDDDSKQIADLIEEGSKLDALLQNDDSDEDILEEVMNDELLINGNKHEHNIIDDIEQVDVEPTERSHSKSSAFVNFENIIQQKTLEYANKIQTLELMIMKLENQLLSESLHKQNHSSTITKLENLILKLENDLLKIHKNYDTLHAQTENILSKQEEQSSKQTNELQLPDKTLHNSEIISQQQTKIQELFEILKNQSSFITKMKDRYDKLEEQNIMLHQMIMNQTIFMTSIIQTVQDLTEQNTKAKYDMQKMKEAIVAANQKKATISKSSIDIPTSEDIFIDKLDAILSDNVEQISQVKQDPAPEEDEDKDDASQNLKQYLGQTPLDGMITQWCPKENFSCPICVYNSIVHSHCVPFPTLTWTHCSVSKTEDTSNTNNKYKSDQEGNVHESALPLNPDSAYEVRAKTETGDTPQKVDSEKEKGNGQDNSLHALDKTTNEKSPENSGESIEGENKGHSLNSEKGDNQQRMEVEDTNQNIDKGGLSEHSLDDKTTTNVKDSMSNTDRKDSVTSTDSKDSVPKSDSKDSVSQTDSKGQMPQTDSKDSVPQTDSKHPVPKSGSKDSVNQTDSKDSVTQTDSKDSVTQTDSKYSVTQTDSKDSMTKTDSKDSVFQTDSKESVTQTDSKDSVTQTNTKDSMTKTDSKDSVPPAHSKDSVTTTESKDSVTTTESKDSVTKTDSKDSVTKTDSKDSVTKTESKDSVPPTDNKDSETKTDSKNSAIQTDSKHPVPPSDSKDSEPPADSKEAVPLTDKPVKTDKNDDTPKDTVEGDNSKTINDNTGKDSHKNAKDEIKKQSTGKEAVSNQQRENPTKISNTNGVVKEPRHLDIDNQKEPKDCYDYYVRGNRRDGLFKVKPVGMQKMIDVYCDMKKGGWTVIQRRQDGSTNFFLEWADYKKGFGGLYGEHWLGNDNIFYLTNQDYYNLRVDLMDWDRKKKYAEFSHFLVEDEAEGYRVHVHGYSGDAGDGLGKHNGSKFSTKDVDNDKIVKELGGSCAKRFSGAGWYYKCYASNLNGKYYKGGVIPEKLFDGVTWKPWTGPNYSLKKVEMKIRPASADTS